MPASDPRRIRWRGALDRAEHRVRFALGGIAIGVVAGLAIIAACNSIWALANGMGLGALWDDTSPAQAALAGAPYAMLGIVGIRTPRAWQVAAVLTAAFWGYYLYAILRPYDGVGANIGLGILMLASPVIIVAAALLTAAIDRVRQPPA
ncbi:hypothetical protein [Sphingomonas baiyangensis]|uniref:Uncharacterized protein n=1 Tax=Sphingomonas baiyangensis TaxID=2572576 RepID=A0A4U1L8A2_9SPHN|nr:hypothetical protein [Sphingomonas baiyangensis]TKD53191.1 hypothetical protein FBR43_02355 [Sphingomonas baiyangensis]